MEWVVIASRIEARIFMNTDLGSLKLLKTFRNSQGRMKNKRLQKDKAGMGRPKLRGSAPYSLTAEKDPHEEAAIKFSKKIADYLLLEGNKDHELTFKVVAEPHFSGLIKGQFGKNKVIDKVSWVQKDLQNVPTSKWPKILELDKIPLNKDMKTSNRKVS